jgi:hypothetical protein
MSGLKLEGRRQGPDAVTILDLLMGGHLLDCGDLPISKSSLGRKKEGDRYYIHLPIARNYLWRALHGRRVRVFLQISTEGGKNEAGLS